MKKTLHSSNTIKNIQRRLLLILFIFSSSLSFSQTITPTKTVVLRPGVCGKIDVELKIEGANPASKPLEVVLVIDVSGSMDDNIHNDPENSLEHAQDAAIDFINKVFLDENNATGKNKIAIVTYANSGTIVKHLLPSENKQELIDAINNLNANGHTNIEDGILKASKELNENGTFDCITSRSIILLTDGVANRNVTNGNNCTDTQNGTCIQNAITAAKNAKITSVSGVTYNNQIFSVGLFGAISGMSQTNAEFTLDKIQTAGKYFTENAADLNGIYTNIFTKLSWVAQQITGTPFDRETVSSDFTIGTVTPSKGTATVSGQVISWNIDFLNVETITLKYELTPKSNVCGNKTVSSSRLDFKNSACTNTFLNHGSCSINIPCPSVTLASQTNVNCFGCHTGVITINDATGGTGPYSYAWKKNGSAHSINKNLTGLEAGVYTVIATDANGCASNELSVTITQPAVLNANVSKTNINCNGANNGTIIVTNPTGGSGTYEYRLDTGTWQASGNFTDVAPATHSVQVRDMANPACVITLCNQIITQPTVTVSVSGIATNVSCHGEKNGSIAITNSTGSTVVITNSANEAVSSTGLPAGTYTLTATAPNGNADGFCTATSQVTITQPEVCVSVSGIATNVSCHGEKNGSIAITNSTGSTVVITNSANEAVSSTGLPAGTYTLTATAPNGNADGFCTATSQVTITQPEVCVSVSGIATNVSCHGEKNGSIAITNSTGSTVVITNSANEVVSSTGLPAGTYTLTATAPNGNADGFCTATSQVTITQPEVCVSVSGIATNVSCHGEKNGSIAITNSTGSTVVITNSANEAVSSTGLPAGTYTLTATAPNGNANGFCTAASQVIISQPNAALSATSVITNNNNCTNCSNGSINLTVTGGTEPYTFLWSNGATTEDIANLIKGSYSVEIKDKNGCIVNYTFIISESSINITKDGNFVDSNQDGITNAGDIVKYSFVITNTGTVDLTNLSITDNNAVVTGGPIPTLLIGTSDSTTFSGTHVITQDDINTGYVYNLATVIAKDPEDKPVTDTSSDPTPCTSCPIDNECPDCTITPLTQSPRLEVIKTAATVSYSKVGDIIIYTITIKNSGNQTLHQIIVKDPLTGLDTFIALLEPGTSLEYTQSYTVTQEDLNKGSVTNVATADGLTPNNTPISATDDEIVNGKTNPIDAVDDNAGTIVGVNQITPNVINVFTNDTLNALAVNPADVILTTVTSNPFLLLNPNGSVDVLPDAPVGTQTMTYQICEKSNSTNCDTAVVTVKIEDPAMTVAGETICINDVPYFSYTATANNFTPVNGLTLTWTDSNNNVIATMTNLPLTGRVLWPGAVVDDNGNGIDWPGWILTDNKWIEGADGFENLRPTAYITFTLNPSQTITANYPPSNPRCTSRPTFKIDAVDDTAGPIDGINGAVNVLNVFNNDTLNTVAVNPADVTLTLVRPDPTGFMTMNPDGSIDLKEGALAGTYTLVYQICENADFGNCDTATVTINVICNNTTKMAGMVFNAGTNTPLANVPVTLIPQGTTTGPILIRITNAQGHYNFTGMPAGDYLLQIQDANLNSAYELYPVDSSLFFTSLEVCKYQFHDFGYDKSELPVLGDFVWYDTNNNGVQDEWFDANNDNLVTQNIPDSNGSFDYSKWEWIDLNGDGSYKGEMNVGELNAAGFGNAKSSNIFVTGPNNYSDSIIIGIQGYWRNRPDEGAFGNYSVELKMDGNLEAQSSAMNATGLVKIIPSTDKNTNSTKTNKAVSFEVCGPTNENPQVTDITATDKVHLDLDFGISCKMFANIQAVNDVYNVTQCSILDELRNAVSNDLLNGMPTAISAFKFKLLTSSVEAITIDTTGNVSFANGVAVGQYTFDYEVCEAANPTNCSTATITINVAGIEPITIASEACNDDTTPIDLTKLLPPGIPADGTWIDTENTGGLIGNILNAVGIPVNKYTFEYKTEGSCPRSIFLTMDINDDCKVLPCKSIVIHNALSANEDGKNDYFQIENIENNDCYKNFKVEIFNRWGILVFERENYNNEGNAFRGQSEGRTTINKNEGLPTGTYFYIISYDTVDGGKIQNIKKDGYLYLIK